MFSKWSVLLIIHWLKIDMKIDMKILVLMCNLEMSKKKKRFKNIWL